MWSSRARNQALGNPRPRLSVDQPRELFGMTFNEARDKVTIVDVRPAEAFNSENLSQNKNIKTPVINIPAEQIQTHKDLPLSKSQIIFVVGETKKNAEDSFQALRRLGYEKTLYFADSYDKLPKMKESPSMPSLETQ